MYRKLKWRLISDYVGAGSYVVDAEKVVVGTAYGLHCLTRPPRRHTRWRANLGSRTLGVREVEGGALLATCRDGLYLVSAAGKPERVRRFSDKLAHEAVPFHEGLALTEGTRLVYCPSWEREPAWSFDLRESLGSKVVSVRPIEVVEIGEFLVAALVDYDSGIGRVHVLDREGKARWMSDLGPISDLFRAGAGSFAWCMTGYEKFESRLTSVAGKELLRADFAGVGGLLKGGSIVMLVGSNESPRWDHWACYHVDAGGKVLASVEVKGRATVRPCCHEDGSVYFTGSVVYIDPSSSRIDYTSFLRMPQELAFQHLAGIRPLLPDYDVYLQKVARPGEQPQVLHNIQGSFSIAPLRILGDEVLFSDGADIVAVDR